MGADKTNLLNRIKFLEIYLRLLFLIFLRALSSIS
jgi:hypothetical protein